MGTLREKRPVVFVIVTLAIAACFAAACEDSSQGTAGALPGDRGGAETTPTRTDAGRDASTDAGAADAADASSAPGDAGAKDGG